MFIKTIKRFFIKRQLRAMLSKQITHLPVAEIDDLIMKVIAKENDPDFDMRKLFAEILAKELLARSGFYEVDAATTKDSIKKNNIPKRPSFNLPVKDDIDNVLKEQDSTFETKVYYKKSYINDIIAKEIRKINIFQPDKIDEILSKLQLLKFPKKFKYLDPILTNIDKKTKLINHKGKLSIYFYDVLLDKTDVTSLVKKWDVFIDKCIKEEMKLQYIDLRTLQNESERSNRLKSIQLGLKDGIWHCAPQGSGSKCQHQHLNNLKFSFETGLYNNITNQFEFPNESIDCYCYSTIFIDMD
jgi:hypothetical protein